MTEPEIRPMFVIERRRGWRSLEFGELWAYRHLLSTFLWRDIKAGQKQTVLGALWLVLSPLFTVAVYTLVFGRIAKLPSDGVPYPLFVFAGQALWLAFAPTLLNTTQSVVNSSHFIQKVYFPRLLIPASAATSSIVNLGFVLVALVGMMCWYRVWPTPTALLAVPIALLVVATALGIGLFLAPLNVKYRDVGMLTQFAVQIGFYLTPIVYPIGVVPAGSRALLALNPLTGYIAAFRWSLYGGTLPVEAVLTAIGITVGLVVGGAFFFARMQSRFADVV